jgi:hypothetical protein
MEHYERVTSPCSSCEDAIQVDMSRHGGFLQSCATGSPSPVASHYESVDVRTECPFWLKPPSISALRAFYQLGDQTL